MSIAIRPVSMRDLRHDIRDDAEVAYLVIDYRHHTVEIETREPGWTPSGWREGMAAALDVTDIVLHGTRPVVLQLLRAAAKAAVGACNDRDADTHTGDHLAALDAAWVSAQTQVFGFDARNRSVPWTAR